MSTKAKFERGKEHNSRSIISAMFDELLKVLVDIEEGESAPDNVAYKKHALKTIMGSIGEDTLVLLVDFLPSLPLLFDLELNTPEKDAEVPSWQLTYSLTKLLEALTGMDRFVLFCCDDLQWADKTAIELLKTVISNLGNLKHSGRRCLFIGLYREDEVDDSHQLSILLNTLQKGVGVNTTNIKLSSLTKKNVQEMVSREFRLPRRLIVEFAAAIHKKTSGHALYVVQLLNSLLRDGIVCYSAERCRHVWDETRIEILETGDNVASLIASNLSSLTPTFQQVLRTLSCFGVQSDLPLIQILDKQKPEWKISSSLDGLIDSGILDRAGPIVRFTHDLIQQTVYESMPIDRRKTHHLELGELLAAEANFDSSIEAESAIMGQIQQDDTFFSGRSMSSSLISIACDQINSANLESINSEEQRMKFIRMNLCAGRNSYLSTCPDLSAALYYYSSGISLLGDDNWFADTSSSKYKVCLQMFEGAVMAR